MIEEELNKKMFNLMNTNNYKGIEDFLKSKPDFNNEKNTFLMYASKNNYLSVVEYCLNNGADIHTENEYSLRLSVRYGNFEIVQYLLKNGADTNKLITNDAFNDYQLFHDINILQCLVEYGFDINTQNDLVLISAASLGNLEIIEYCLKCGANIHTLNEEPLIEAVSKEYTDIVEYLYLLYENKKLAQKIIIKYANQEIKNWLKSRQLNDKLEKKLILKNKATDNKKTKL